MIRVVKYVTFNETKQPQRLPACCGFRLQPVVPGSGVAAGRLPGGFPVRVRQVDERGIAGELLFVWDSGWNDVTLGGGWFIEGIGLDESASVGNIDFTWRLDYANRPGQRLNPIAPVNVTYLDASGAAVVTDGGAVYGTAVEGRSASDAPVKVGVQDAAGLVRVPEALLPSGAGDKYALRTARKGHVLWDSGVVAAGAVINSPVFDLTGIETVQVVAQNGDGAARGLSIVEYLDDGVTAVFSGTMDPVPAGLTHAIAFGPGSAAGGSGYLAVAFPACLPTKAKFTLAAGVGGNGRVTVFGR